MQRESFEGQLLERKGLLRGPCYQSLEDASNHEQFFWFLLKLF
jgi:hypothetical protein